MTSVSRLVRTGACAVLIVGALGACGSDDGAATATSTGNEGVAAGSDVRTDLDNIPGMAMGTPPETASMNCGEDSCDIVFIPPSDLTVRPFGMAVKLVSSDEKGAAVEIDGTRHDLAPGGKVTVSGATVSIVGTPGSVVTLNFRRA